MENRASRLLEPHSIGPIVVLLSGVYYTFNVYPWLLNCSSIFQGDIANLQVDIKEIESAIRTMRAEHASMEDRLESLRSRSPMVHGVAGQGSGHSPGTLLRTGRTSTTRSSSSSGSLKSSMSTASPDGSEFGQRRSEPRRSSQRSYNEWDNEDDGYGGATPPPPPPLPQQQQYPNANDHHHYKTMAPRYVQ